MTPRQAGRAARGKRDDKKAEDPVAPVAPVVPVAPVAPAPVPPPPPADRWRDLLEARAAMKLKPWPTERAFFLCYDAWTDPRFRGYVRTRHDLLSTKAKKFYGVATLPVAPHPQPPPPVADALLDCGFQLLPHVPLDRAGKAFNHLAYGIPVRVEGEDRALLDQHGLSARELIDGLAALQFSIYHAHYPQKGKAQPSPELALAFARFADGQLRLSFQGDEAQLNAEPDSAWFFVFAEFCIQAAHFGSKPSAKWWLRLAALFTRLNDVYCARYLPRSGNRRWSTYGNRSYDATRPPLSKAELDAIVKEARAYSGSIADLVTRVTESAVAAFRNDLS